MIRFTADDFKEDTTTLFTADDFREDKREDLFQTKLDIQQKWREQNIYPGIEKHNIVMDEINTQRREYIQRVLPLLRAQQLSEKYADAILSAPEGQRYVFWEPYTAVEPTELWQKNLMPTRSLLDTQSAYAYQIKANEKYKGKTYDELLNIRSELYANKPSEPPNPVVSYQNAKAYASGDPVYSDYQRRQKQFEGELAAVENALGEYFISPLTEDKDFDKTADIGAKKKNNAFHRELQFFAGIGHALKGNPLDYITDEEKRLGDYWYGVSDDAGIQYYKWLENILMSRVASNIAEKTDTALESGALALVGGLDQFFSGVLNTVAMATGKRDVYQGVLSRANQQNIARVAEDSWLGKMGLQLITATANMAPSILIGAGTGNPLIGSASMGVSASGNAYSQAIQSGADPARAAAYGLLIGAAEATLQYFIGKIPGMSKAGGVIANKIDDAIKTVVKSPKVLAVLEVAAKIGAASGSEGFEEYLQNILDPILQRYILNQDAEIDLVEALEEGLLGAVSGGLFSVPGSIQSTKINNAISSLNQAQRSTPQTAAPVAPTQPPTPAVTAKPTTAQEITQTLKSTGEITAAQIDTIVKSKENRIVFTQETGVELPSAIGDARRTIRGYQADINSGQANAAVQPATINAGATTPQTGVDVPFAESAVVEPVNAQESITVETSKTAEPAQTVQAPQTATAQTDTDTFGKSVGAATKQVQPTATEKMLLKELRKAESNTAKARELTEHYRGQLKRTTKPKSDVKVTKALAESVVKEYSSHADVADVADRIADIYEKANSRNESWDSVNAETKALAAEILSRSVVENTELAEQYADLIEVVKGTPIAVSKETYKGDYKAFQDEYAKHIKIRRTGKPIAKVYSELTETYPELFKGTAETEQAMLDEIFNALTDIEPYAENVYAADMDAAADVLSEMLLGDILMLDAAEPTFADKAIADKQAALKKLRTEKDAKIAELKENSKQRIKEIIKEQRQRRADLEAKYKLKISETRVKNKTKRERAAYRAKIKRNVKRLAQKMQSKSIQKHIPPEYVKVTAQALAALDFTTNRQAPETVAKLRSIAHKYTEIAENAPVAIINPHIETNLNVLENSLKESGAARIADMTNDQLKIVANVLAGLNHAITQANKAFSTNIKEEISLLARGAESAWKDLSPKKKARMGAVKRMLTLDQASAGVVFKRLGEAFAKLYDGLREGFSNYTFYEKDAIRHFHETLGDDIKDAYKWHDGTELVNFALESGQSIRLTPAQAMCIYAINKQEDGRRHLLNGGIKPKSIIRKGKSDIVYDRVFELTEADVDNIIGVLSKNPKQIKIADKLVKYFETCAERGNKTTRRVYGYDIFTVLDYFTLNVDPDSRNKILGGVFVPALEQYGSARARVDSKLPLTIDSIFNVYAKHTEGMARYSALLPAIKDIERVLNYKDKDMGINVLESLKAAYGNETYDYIQKFIADVSKGNFVGAETGAESLTQKFIRGIKSAAVGANVRVAAQQYSAYVRALAVLDEKYLLQGLKKSAKKGFETALKYSDVAVWKSWGYNELDVGRSLESLMFQRKGLIDTAMYGMAKADEQTFGKLWNASEAAISDTTDYEYGSKEYYEAVKNLYNKVIDETQVVDTILHRTHAQRSKNVFMHMLTSFKAEPFKQYNLLYKYWGEYAAGKTPQTLKKALRATNAALVQTMVNSAIVVMIDMALRGKEDEEERTTGDRLIDYAFELADGAFGMFLYSGEAWSVIRGFKTGRMDMQVIVKGLDAAKKAFQAASGDGITPYMATKSVVEALSMFSGVPAYNVLRDVESAVRKAAQATDNYYAEYAYTKVLYDVRKQSNRKRFYDVMYKAYRKGDLEQYKKIKQDLLQYGYTEENISSAIKSRAGGKTSEVYEGIKTQSEFVNASVAGIGYSANDDIPLKKTEIYTKLRGGYASGIVPELTESSAYKSLLEEEQQNKTISYALTYAAERAERDVLGKTADTAAWVEKAIKAEKRTEISPYKYILAKTVTSDKKTWKDYSAALKKLGLFAEYEIRYLYNNR